MWPENVKIVTAFFIVSGQWRVVQTDVGKLVYFGLDYQAVKAGLELAGVTLNPDEWAGIRIMEQEVVRLVN